MSLEEKLGYFFFDKRILARSLTRKAYALEQPQLCADQEAYSLLGNALIDTVLTEWLIRSGCDSQPEIVVRKIELTQVENLARMGQELEMEYLIKRGAGEKQQNVYQQPDVLAETVEAAIAGIYFDGGYSAARQTIQRLFKLDPL
jgi:ribonuclease-3